MIELNLLQKQLLRQLIKQDYLLKWNTWQRIRRLAEENSYPIEIDKTVAAKAWTTEITLLEDMYIKFGGNKDALQRIYK